MTSGSPTTRLGLQRTTNQRRDSTELSKIPRVSFKHIVAGLRLALVAFWVPFSIVVMPDVNGIVKND